MRHLGLLAALLMAPAALFAQVKPDAREVDGVEHLLERANWLMHGGDAKHPNPHWTTILEVEKEVGLRDLDGKLRRCPIPPPYFAGQGEADGFRMKMDKFAREREEAFERLRGRADLDDYLAASRAYKNDKEEAVRLYNEAIEKTIEAYKLLPLDSQGTILSGPPQPKTQLHLRSHLGKTAVFRPVFSDDDDGTVMGKTRHDGHVAIGPGAFEYAGRLAFIIHHESQHFKDLLTPGMALWNEPDNEVRIREKSRRYRGSVFQLRQEHIAQDEVYIASARVRAEGWRDLKSQGLDPYNKKDRPSFMGAALDDSAYDGSDLFGVKARLDEIRRQEDILKTNLERHAEERRVPAVSPPGWPPAPPVAPPVATPPGSPRSDVPRATPPMAPISSNLNLLAEAACRNPQLPDEEVQRWLGGYPDGMDWGRHEVHGCADELYNEMMQRNVGRESVTCDWLRGEAARLRQKYAPPPPGGGEGPRGNDGDGGGMHGNPRPPRPSPNPWKGS